jgi:hypothetical protein
MVFEMARPTAAEPMLFLRPTEKRHVATTSTAPKKSHLTRKARGRIRENSVERLPQRKGH